MLISKDEDGHQVVDMFEDPESALHDRPVRHVLGLTP